MAPPTLRLPHDLVPLALIALWLATLLGLSAALPPALASWVTFVALLITPGYLLTELLASPPSPAGAPWAGETRQRGARGDAQRRASSQRLDLVERLAVALPLGITALAIPGLASLLSHGTIQMLILGWQISSGLLVVLWLGQRLTRARPPIETQWQRSEQLALLLLALLFVALLPVISLHKIDGDAYAVSTFTADALAGRPLHQVEPLFGTELGPGVRMLFNQSLPVTYLWSALSGVDPITLAASLARGPFALWILLAAYALGYAATGRRRTALLVLAFQFLIFLSAPFLRGDNISLFFFERTDADKFLVPMALLPVVVALTLRYVRSGARGYWVLAAAATLAVSAIHPLIAAMLALALTAFAALHLLASRGLAWRRVGAVGALVVLVMLLPLVQLLLARGEAPLAPSYPDSFEGWPLAEQQIPILPGIDVTALDLAGSPPALSSLRPEDALDTVSPLLFWRVDVNLDRRRLLFFGQDSYISDPNLLFEPPYLLALFLLPLLWWRRRVLGAQYAVATTLAILLVMFTPVLTPLIGGLVMPWILWRFIWLLPTALILALVWEGLFLALAHRLPTRRPMPALRPVAPLLGLALLALLLTPLIERNLTSLWERSASPYRFPAPEALYDRLEAALGPDEAVVMADPEISVTLPAYVANADIVAHRVPTTSEIFPADQQPLALQRLIDQDAFFRSAWLTAESIDLLARYRVEYLILSSGTPLESQLRLATSAFERLTDEGGYTLYRVRALPDPDAPAIRGNSAMASHEWAEAESAYRAALVESPNDLLAQLGMVEVGRLNGQFAQAIDRLSALSQRYDTAPIHARLGQLRSERGDLDGALAAYRAAQQAAPDVPHYHILLADACLRTVDRACATEHYEAAIADQHYPDPASALLAEGALWRAQGEWAQALDRYEAAVRLNGNAYNRFVLASALQEVGRYDEAATLLDAQRRRDPLDAATRLAQASLLAQRGETDRAIAELQALSQLQSWLGQSPLATQQALAQLLLDAGRLTDAQPTLDRALAMRPADATTHRLLGDLYRLRGEAEVATAAYHHAYALDSSQLGVVLALREEAHRAGEPPETVIPLLEEAAQQNPDQPTLTLLLGDEWAQQGESERAIAAYRTAIQALSTGDGGQAENPQSLAATRAFASARLAESYEALARPEAALNYYRVARATLPAAGWTHVQLGDALRRADRYDEAERSYRSAISTEPGYLDGYLRLADLLTAQNRVDEAGTLLAEVEQLSTQPIPPPVRGQLGLVLTDRATPVAVSDETTEPRSTPPAPTAAPTDSQLGRLNALTTIYERQGRLHDAVALFEAALSSEGSPARDSALQARYAKGLADLQLTLGNLPEALRAYEEAVALDAGWPTARLGLGQALALAGEEPAALEHLTEAATLAPGAVDIQLALADLLIQQGQVTRAHELVDQLAQRQPGDPRALRAAAQLLVERDAWAEAEVLFRRAITLAPGDSEGYLALADYLIARGELDEAEQQLNEAMARDQRNGVVYLRLGDVAALRGDSDSATRWYNEATALVQNDQALESTLLDRSIETGLPGDALAMATGLLERYPTSIELLRRTAQLHSRLGAHAEAEQLLQRARTLAPENPRLASALGEVLRATDNLAEAQTLYQEAIDLSPQESSYHLALSEIQSARANQEGAIDTLVAALPIVDNPEDVAIELAARYRAQGRPEEAQKVLEAAIAQDEQSVTLAVALGAHHALRGERSEAIEQYERALALDPENAAALVALGRALAEETEAARAQLDKARASPTLDTASALALGEGYAALGLEEQAEDAWSQAIALAPTLPQGYLQLAQHHTAGGDTDAARGVYEQGLALLPASGPLHLAYAAFLEEQGDAEAAASHFEQARSLAPTAETLVALAARGLNEERTEDALADLHRALQQQPGNYQALLAMGDLYREVGDRARATQFYERAIAQQPGVASGTLRLAGLAVDIGDSAEAERLQALAREVDPTLETATAP